ncbi:DUF2855 family protein [Sandaracinobacteroides hominis]|uniref:DUF2855 family protein n=1 Tax=Sandaracinobacteroides hominis TaxID=2780086 RepID=UPI0018F2C6FE|nr:DUF2855 family protein [Sandaracinobacteroides hominis]
MGYQLERKRDALVDWREVGSTPSAGPGEIVARIDLAALTSNNITYAVFGRPPLSYWNFFPAADEAWGVVPVWGYATVIESRSEHVAEGSKLFGYWPSATHLKMLPGNPRPGGFVDMSPHRQGLSPVYNSYRLTDDPPELEPLVALFQPLYGTGYVLAGSLAAEAASGAPIIFTSASSKTALATAFNLGKAGANVIGLTSAGNKAFVEQTGFYRQVLTYDEIDELAPGTDAVVIDFSGNAALKKQLHQTLVGMASSIAVGVTDWEALQPPDAEPLPGPQPSFFFAPTLWEEQARTLGPAKFEANLASSMRQFLETTPRWLRVEEVRGVDGYAQAFGKLMQNRSPANTGIVWKP